MPMAEAAGNLESGQKLFKWCASCHQVGPSARNGFGPQLNGVIGRRAGTTDYRYSPAMKSAGVIWTEANLAAFMRDPAKVVPGTKMRFWGIGNDQEIADILSYLRTFQSIPQAGQQ